jgi:hypothetical protein
MEHQSDEMEIVSGSRNGNGNGRTIPKESRTSEVVGGSYL